MVLQATAAQDMITMSVAVCFVLLCKAPLFHAAVATFLQPYEPYEARQAPTNTIAEPLLGRFSRPPFMRMKEAFSTAKGQDQQFHYLHKVKICG